MCPLPMRAVTLVVFVLIVAAAVLVFIRWRRLNATPGTVVLGTELASARAVEERRIARGAGPSPLAGVAYRTHAEIDLIRVEPSAADAGIAALCHRFRTMTLPDRIALRDSISMDDLYTLLTFAQRMAVFGLRERRPERVRDGLSAVALIDVARVDYRDALMTLSILNHASTRLGTGATLFKEAAALADPALAAVIQRSARQSADLKADAGFAEVETKYGIGLIRWGLEPYEPSRDLAGLGVEMSELIEADRYRQTSIEIATTLPDVWFEAPNDFRLKDVLSRVRAGATVAAVLAVPHEDDNQDLWAFIVEVPENRDAETLRLIAEKTRERGSPVAGIARDRLFCLLVGRSSKRGVPSIETPASLARFAPKIEALLARHTEGN